jgi:hypothetical protein
MTIVRLSALFEAYAQCWAVNYLAAVLENDKSWSRTESELARSFHPVHGSGHVPSWPQITKAIPMLRVTLQELPHLFTDPGTGAPVVTPVSNELNAFTAIEFWRAFRNLSIHTSRLITRRFFERYAIFFDRMMTELRHLDRLEPGKRMPLHDDMYSAMAAVQYKSALWMNEHLMEMAAHRRGHPEAPRPVTKTVFEKGTQPPPLFVEGDHWPSLRWIVDADFREQLSRQEGWQLLTIRCSGPPTATGELKHWAAASTFSFPTDDCITHPFVLARHPFIRQARLDIPRSAFHGLGAQHVSRALLRSRKGGTGIAVASRRNSCVISGACTISTRTTSPRQKQ